MNGPQYMCVCVPWSMTALWIVIFHMAHCVLQCVIKIILSLWCSMYVTQGKELQTIIYLCLNAAPSKKSIDLCVSIFVGSQGHVPWCATHLPLCSTKGPVKISLLAKKDFSQCRCRRKSFLLLLTWSCQACMPVSAKIYARCQRQLQT